ncbi:hypothetical protein [Flavobacterium terrae]|uniref:Uncharacterized protein n=1 Tax=Flavobacterium terrae TaxID=415425 RepID=A0A1M6EZ26_9FLAO|nr:hypothetical protein [Flavobacterium terrae]SHI90717.1 hypothetical protein SAMN05444363_2044 [Flavobacterium terrae]
MKYILIGFITSFCISCQKDVENQLQGISYDKVVVYSFESRTPPPPPPIQDDDSLNSSSEIKNIDIVLNGKITLSEDEIKDKIILNNSQIEDLVNFIKEDYCKIKATVAACYAPRHLIAFFKKNKLSAYYEFCIECGNDKRSKKLYKYPEFCLEKGEKAKELLKQFGVKYLGD